MVGRKEKKRLLRSNAQRERKILQRAQLFARRNSFNPGILSSQPPKTPVQLVSKQCPLKGCDSSGHLNGLDQRHITISACPLYHNAPPQYWRQMREREEGIAPSEPTASSADTITMSPAVNRASHLYTLREPNLEKLTSSVFLYQFRRAQQKLVSEVEREVQEHLIFSARLRQLEQKANPSTNLIKEQDCPPSATYNNLSCLLIMPHYQRKGYGRMLVEFSYLLSRLEGRVGSPERPLSDHGLLLYQNYWRWVVVSYLAAYELREINIRSVSESLGVDVRDIVSTLLDLGLLKYIRTEYYIVNDKSVFRRILSEMRPPDESRRIDRNLLHWRPPKASQSANTEAPV
nr:unnamed protein product [Spirometra erinaceieuropaei]